MAKLKLHTALLILGATLTLHLASAECDITKCGVPKHYREIGCEPTRYAPTDKDKCCPIEYNCDEIGKQDAAKCHFRGKVYNDGDTMSDQEANCRAACRCQNGTFTCAHVECPELVFNRPEPHCVVQNTRAKCCSEAIVCDKEAIEKLHVCHMDGQEYRKGQIMYPSSHKCFTCLCDEKFDNSTAVSQNPACSEVDCAIDLSRLAEIRSGCVPVYYGEPTCCPIATKCRK